jgi:uroporphyrinogen-III synthase
VIEFRADKGGTLLRAELNEFFRNSDASFLFDNFPEFKQSKVVIGAFGSNTSKAVEDAKLRLDIKAPAPQRPSLVAALDHYLQSLVAKK